MKISTKDILSLYWRHAWRYRGYVIGLLIMIPVALFSFRLLPPIIVASILNRLSSGDYVVGQVWESFSSEIVAYAIVTLLGGIVAWRIVVIIIWKLEASVVRDLYRAMFAKLMSLDTNFHANSFGGSLVSQTNKLTGSYIRLADTFVFQVYTLVLSLAFISILLIDSAPLFVAGMLTFSALFIIFTVILSRRVRNLAATEAAAQNRTTGYLADAVTNVMAVKAFASKNAESKRFAKATENTRQRTLDVMWAAMKRDLFASTVTSSLQVMAVIVAIISVVMWQSDIGTVFLVLTYSILVADRLWEFNSNVLRNYNRSIGDAQEGVSTLNRPLLVADADNPLPLAVKEGRINFSNVNFAHEEDQTKKSLFKNFNLEIRPGEKIGLVGHSGSGKTSLTKILLRFMDIESGQILIDGQDISKAAQDELRSHLAYVPQEPLLFHRSIAENISYGQPNASETQIIDAAKKAHAHEFIKDLPDQYQTLVGERGVKLSGGQRQRIAIARAMLKDAPILILDEATSALDSESEKLIQDALWKLMEGRTAIVIAHRLSTVQKMNRIIVLEGGKIVEQGSHTELLSKKGVYSRLWKHQSGGFLED